MPFDIEALKKNKFMLVGGALVVIGVTYEYRKRAAAATAATATTASGATDNSTALGDESIDPSTGIPYSEEALGAADPYSAAYDSAAQGSPYSSYSGLTWDPATGQWVSNTSGTTSTGTGSQSGLYGTPTSNAQWGQEATLYLTNLGDDPITVAAALGKFLSGQGGSLTSAQLSIVQSAIGALGYPPTAVPAPAVAPPTGQTNPGAGITSSSKSLSEAQVRAASPNVRAIYNEYLHQVPGSALQHEWQTAYQDSVNDYRQGGEARVPTLAAEQANISRH